MRIDEIRAQVRTEMGLQDHAKWQEHPDGFMVRFVRGGTKVMLTPAQKALKLKSPTRGGVVSHSGADS